MAEETDYRLSNGTDIAIWPANLHHRGRARISVIPRHPDFDVKRIRIYLDSPKIAGWNEIDAVGLVDVTGKTSWAASAIASSTYADVVAGESSLRVLEPRVLEPSSNPVQLSAPRD